MGIRKEGDRVELVEGKGGWRERWKRGIRRRREKGKEDEQEG